MARQGEQVKPFIGPGGQGGRKISQNRSVFFDHATLAEVRDKFRDDQRGEPQKKRVGVKINV
jgi:hypothetical protein